MSTSDPDQAQAPYRGPTALPKRIPPVDEVGATSAPLKSAAFFIGGHCQEYNEDFMLCKAENRDPAHCLKEGRRVTRCAADIISKLREACGKEFDTHWQCLDLNNQEYYKCRPSERIFNQCVFAKLGLKKTIPGSVEGKAPVHELPKPIFKPMQK